jgi:hypothetical protein
MFVCFVCYHYATTKGLVRLSKDFKPTMIFRPECHGFHKSAFVMVIKVTTVLLPFIRYDVSWWLSYKVSGHHLS